MCDVIKTSLNSSLFRGFLFPSPLIFPFKTYYYDVTHNTFRISSESFVMTNIIVLVYIENSYLWINRSPLITFGSSRRGLFDGGHRRRGQIPMVVVQSPTSHTVIFGTLSRLRRWYKRMMVKAVAGQRYRCRRLSFRYWRGNCGGRIQIIWTFTGLTAAAARWLTRGPLLFHLIIFPPRFTRRYFTAVLFCRWFRRCSFNSDFSSNITSGANRRRRLFCDITYKVGHRMVMLVSSTAAAVV